MAKKQESNGQYQINLNSEKDFVLTGSSPMYVCTVYRNASFLIGNPLKWEKRGRNGSKLVISVLSNVEEGSASEYNVELESTENATTSTLSFLQGMKLEYDGHFACVLYNQSNVVLAEKKVDVHVIQPIKRFKFKIADQLVTKIDEPAFAIRLEDGFYNPVCKTEGSNPPTIVKIYFDNTEYLGEQIVKIDNSGNQSSTLYNVEKRVTIKLRPNENDKILKCVAQVNTDITIIAEMSYQLTVFSIPPEISCKTITALNNNTFVDLTCLIKLPRITCQNGNIFWENGQTKDWYPVNYNKNGIRVFCSNSVQGTASTTLRIYTVTDKDFVPDYYVVYINKHQTITRKKASFTKDDIAMTETVRISMPVLMLSHIGAVLFGIMTFVPVCVCVIRKRGRGAIDHHVPEDHNYYGYDEIGSISYPVANNFLLSQLIENPGQNSSGPGISHGTNVHSTNNDTSELIENLPEIEVPQSEHVEVTVIQSQRNPILVNGTNVSSIDGSTLSLRTDNSSNCNLSETHNNTEASSNQDIQTSHDAGSESDNTVMEGSVGDGYEHPYQMITHERTEGHDYLGIANERHCSISSYVYHCEDNS
ncbi:Hypothetical predicted protein [Mytilus galloprovincialis]|uniref:Ig-like domain-containing protein n=1 Tax=Mytilus galloprovincialis TaxID=29158 RepID=A0A8B6FN87_MYTGA|nr:Hypothetical predicted protein [Mytilus galloprovincialis]